MKISNKWLQDYIDLQCTHEELEKKLTFAGIEVENIEFIGKEYEQFIVAEIVERKPHPNADNLSVCKVNTGSEQIQIVCGAPNCDANQKAVLAPVGAKIAEITIKKAKLRGEVSFGMLCSAKELGLTEDHSGIMILKQDAEPGQSLASYLQLDDICFDMEITPNRPDLLGFLGISRDLSAVTGKQFSPPNSKFQESNDHISDFLQLCNENPVKCTRYTARMIQNVRVEDSPEWLQRRLKSVGLRPINNIVDISNYVMMEYGHPLHAFDYDKIKDHKIIVRNATDKEKFGALDGEEYELSSADLVIADSEKPIALAGVIGGNNSHITNETKTIVIEAANFLYSTVRKTSNRYKIFTDSSYRFERDLADVTADLASRRAVQLVLEIAGGQACSGILDTNPGPIPLENVSLRLSRLQKLTSVSFTPEDVIKYLKPLGLDNISSIDDTLTFSIPHFRKDLTREIDLIEEVIRLHGYNNVQEKITLSKIMNRVRFYQRREVQDLLVQAGCNEVVNWTFGDPEDLQKLNLDVSDRRMNSIKVQNPLGSRCSILRTTLLPDLLSNLHYNINHGAENIRLFENNKVFFKDESPLAYETEEMAAVFTGYAESIHWSNKGRLIDFYDVKGVFEQILDVMGITKYKYVTSTENFYQNGVAADAFFKGKKIGSIGKLDPKTVAKFGVDIPVFFLQLKFGELTSKKIQKSYMFHEISKFPTIHRDLSFVVSRDVSHQKLIETIQQTNPSIIKKVTMFDEYRGDKIKSGYHSLSFSLSLNSHTKTLTDDYVNNLVQKIIKILNEKFQIEMR